MVLVCQRATCVTRPAFNRRGHASTNQQFSVGDRDFKGLCYSELTLAKNLEPVITVTYLSLKSSPGRRSRVNLNHIHGIARGLDVLHISPRLWECYSKMAKPKSATSPSANERLTKIESTVSTLKWVAPMAVTLLGVVVVLTFTVFLPEKIENSIARSESLKERFASVEKSLEKISTDMKLLVTPSSVSDGLKGIASLDEKSLGKALPNAKSLLATTRELRLPVAGRQYKEISQAFATTYHTAKEPLKEQIWDILVDLANTRTFTDAKLFPVQQSKLDEAKATGNYFEGNRVDLSSKSDWTKSIFRNCVITINNPHSLFSLEDTRFMDCTFEVKADDGVNQKLLASLLESQEPTITVPKFIVEKPRYQPNS